MKTFSAWHISLFRIPVLAFLLGTAIWSPAGAVDISATDVFNNWSRFPAPSSELENGTVAIVGNEIGLFGPGGEPARSLISDFVLTGNSTFSGSFRTTGTDDDLIGIIFGWQDLDNHYRFGWDAFDVNQGALDTLGANGVVNASPLPGVHGRRLIAESADVNTFLFQDPGPNGAIPYARNTLYNFAIERNGNLLNFFLEIDGGATLLDLSVSDTTFTSGRVGIYSDSQSAALFSNLMVVSDVPEPGPILLLGLGIVGLATLRWRLAA